MVEMIANKYRVLKKLGQGAMGEVWLVMPPRGEPVALKLLKSLEEENENSALEQFENEFRVLKKLSHPNIGRLIDYGYDEELGKVFFTLPWLRGTDIYEHCKNKPFEECEELFIQCLRAINYLHQKKIYHCDLKPGNIFVEDNKALLIDFGLAGYFGEFIVGTPTYLAPEIYQGSKHNVSSDLYALGVIFYNCLTRTQPFTGKTLQEVYDRHRTLTPPPIHTINNRVPKYFSDIVATMLNKKSEERFPSAGAVIEEISAFSKKTYTVETKETLLSYLPTDSDLVGRKDALLEVQKSTQEFLDEQSTVSYHVLQIHGPNNVGKSKFIEKIKNDLQLSKISVETVLPPFQEEERQILSDTRALLVDGIALYKNDKEEKESYDEILSLIEEKVVRSDSKKFLFIISGHRPEDFEDIDALFPEDTTNKTIIELLPYTKPETEEYLKKIIGQQEIPKTFIDQFYRNTGGLPGIAYELIQTMIKNGLLFDPSGRWNEDLLAKLDHAFENLEISESLEQEFEKTYNLLTPTQEDIIKWLCLCPHGLTEKQLNQLTKTEKLTDELNDLLVKKILRRDSEKYFMYRVIFQKFVKSNLPNKVIQNRHVELAKGEIQLEKKWAFYHLSFAPQKELSIKASYKLAESYEKDGQRNSASHVYLNLLEEHKSSPLQQRVAWVLQASELLIGLDKFNEAKQLISDTEDTILSTKASVETKDFLKLLEKKGLCLLHLQQTDKAEIYFQKGLQLSRKNKDCLVLEIRFENNLAEVNIVKGNLENAIQTFIMTRKKAEQLSKENKQIITNNDLGHVYLMQQKYEKCIEVLSEDIKTFSDMTNQEPLTRALYSFAQALQMLEKNDKAISAFQECVRLCKRENFQHLLIRAYMGLGNLYVSLERLDFAIDNYQKALELSIRLNDNTSKAALLFNQGYIYQTQKNIALATRRFTLSTKVLENKKRKIPYDYSLLSKCYHALGNISAEEENHPMKAMGYFLERKNLASQTTTSHEELFSISQSLAEIYLKTRLKDKFQEEMKELEKLIESDEQREEFEKLTNEWNDIENHAGQSMTGVIKDKDFAEDSSQ